MFLSLNRKIVYSILGLFLVSSLIFILTFYTAYSSKIEKDQQASITRNQQYSDLLYHNTNIIKELKNLLTANPNISITPSNYQHIYSFVYDPKQSDFLQREQKALAERTQQFDEQYKTINQGVKIIVASAILLSFLIIFIGYLINRWVLTPINNISNISEQIALGNLNLRIPPRTQIKYHDELDKLSSTFNLMLDNLENMISEVKDKENFLQALIDSIPDGIRVIDENYRIIIANKSYYKQTGDTPHNCKTCYTSSFKTDYPCNPQNIYCPLHEILQKGKKSINTIQQFANLPNRHLAVNAAPLIYDTHRKYIVESIHDLSKDIDFSHQQKISSLGFLSSSLAHEIKNHLGALRIIIEHLIDKYYANKPDDNDEKKMINMIHSELVNAVNVPERLLKLTRGYDSNETQINCGDSISDVLSLLDFEAKSKGVDIDFKIPAKPSFINGNETDFKIAVINIILNAIKAMPNKGNLKIKLSNSSQSGIKISFTDTGIGISKTVLPNIFNPFFSDGRQGKSGASTGLGLAITKSIIEKFGGSINVTSTIGKGTCFTLCFPTNKKLAKK
ncbi:MAG: HAMP domain-containing protein [Alphaproteobacteria bacterium]|nr:HAMP domain-containing protein [Alphaproteobacteria bacterium]